MSNTENLGLKIPTLAEKNIHTTYVNNNEIIDEAYGQYLEDKETAQENIAMIETPVAQSNHTAGSYFMLDNVLHKATENIASGEDIVSGSNATPITIEQALSVLNSSVSALQDSVAIGKGTFDTAGLMVYGHVSGSGNYAVLCFPYHLAGDVTSAALGYSANTQITVFLVNTFVNMAAMDASYCSIAERGETSFTLELKFSSTQQSNRPCVVRFVTGSSITFT